MVKENKWLVVTGGTKGIGKAILESFMDKGFHAITCARNATELDSLQSMAASRFPHSQLKVMVADLSQKAEALAFASFVASITPEVEVLVNNTGTFLPGQIENEADGTLETMIQTNLYSAYHVTRGLLPLFIAQKRGHIFTICSTASIMPYLNGGSYCISKYALLGMTKVLREEMKRVGVRVTAVLPGATLTASWEGVDLPAQRFMRPEDVGAAVFACYQLSEQTVVEELLLRPQLGDI